MESSRVFIYNRIVEELIEKYPSLRKTEIHKMVTDYFSNVQRALSFGNKGDDSTYVKRIRFGDLGSIIFNINPMKHQVEGNKRYEVNYDYYKTINTVLYLAGWQLIRWTVARGYIFYNDYNGEQYDLKEEYITGKEMAKLHFYNYLTNNEKANLINELRYNGKLLKYDSSGDIVEEIANYDELSIKYPENNVSILKSIIYNSKKRAGRNSMKIGNYIWIKKEDKDKKDIIYNIHKDKKHRYKIDIVDMDTNEVIHKSYGDVADCSEFIKIIGKYNKPTQSNIVKVIDTDKSAYGFKWKKS